jgi:hypothetical protein
LTRFFDFDISRFMKIHRRKPASIAKTRWAAYAAAGAATALGGTNSAEAEIHYSGIINARFDAGSFTGRHLGHFSLDRGARLTFLKCYGIFYNQDIYYGAFFGIDGAAVSNSFRGYPTGHGSYYVSRLAPGKLVSQGDFVRDSGLAIMTLFSYCSGLPWGYQPQGQVHPGGFVGFRFDNGGGMQYGWARLKYRDPECGVDAGFFLVDYAWGDPGDTIRTGQTSSSGDMVDTVTESGSLGLLALGGAGLLAWRKQRGQTTQ